MSKTIGQKLTELRGEKSQIEVANAVGISPSAIWMYENDERIPRDEVKMKFAEYYNKSVGEIFFGE